MASVAAASEPPPAVLPSAPSTGLTIEPLAPAPGLAIEPLAPAPGLAIEPLAPVAPAAPTETRLFGAVATSSAIDTRWEPLEHVVDQRERLRLGVEHRDAAGRRFWIEGRLTHFLVAREPSRAHPLGRERKAELLVEPGELYVDLPAGPLRLRLGHQVLSFAANPGFSAAEPLVPLDLTAPPPAGDPEAAKLPVPAAKLSWELAPPLSIDLVLVPVAIPSRLSLSGQDFSLAQPGGPLLLPALSAFVDPTVEDRLQDALLAGRRPRAYLVNGDAALTLALRPAGGPDLRLTHAEAWDKLPHFTLDPALQRVLAALAAGRNPATDPALQRELERLSLAAQRGGAGDLVTSELGRTRVTSAAATWLVGDAQLDLDLAFEPTRTLYVIAPASDGTQAVAPRHRRTVAAALGVSDADGGDWLLAGRLGAELIFGVRPDEWLIFLETEDDAGDARRVLRGSAGGSVTWRPEEGDVELSLSGSVGLPQRDFLAVPRASLQLVPDVTLGVEAWILDGPTGSIGGLFSRNDRVACTVDAAF